MAKLNVGLMGFGKTGSAVARVLLESNAYCLEWVLRRSNKLNHRSVPEFLGIESSEPGLIYSTSEISMDRLYERHPVDVIVDFSAPEGLDYYAGTAAAERVKVVSAVSQYPHESLGRLKRLAEETLVLYSPNITLGVNFLMIAAKVLRGIAPHADVEVVEEHFKGKAEVSGTARIIARNLGMEESEIKSVRAGGIIGVHEILFGFPYQTVRLRHESIMREAFGNGVLFALDHLPDAERGLLSLQDLMIPYFHIADLPRTDPDWWRINSGN